VSAIDPGRHPDNLPWYVSGRLDASESEGIAQHCRDCPECRLEVEALESMRRTLVTYREELDLLEKAAGGDRDEGGWTRLSARRRLSPRTWGLLGASAATVLFVAVVLRPGGLRRTAPEPALAPVASILFLPPQRGTEPGRTLAGTGPWSIGVALPLGAPAGDYDVRIDGEGDRASVLLRTTVTATSDGRLTLLLRALPGAGRYRLSAAPLGPGDGSRRTEYAYPFEVIP
jgi:anti-sigma factor RsiW